MPLAQRYTAVAISLHWLIAAAILANIALGLWMGAAINSASAQAGAVSVFQFHKSLGLTVLVLSLLRLAWRLLYPPPQPVSMVPWQQRLATATHWLFYGLMIAIPLSGWFYVSAQWRGDAPFNIPTLWFGLFEVPHLFGLGEAGRALRQQVAAVAFNTHGAMALALVILLVLHVGAALGHHFILRDGVLARMLPWLASREQPIAAPSGQRPSGRNLAAAGMTVLVAALLIGYAATTRLTSAPVQAATGKAAVLQTLVTGSATQAPLWPVATANSHIRFAGVHAGRRFNGHFGDWQAAIHIDSQAPQQSFIAAVVATGSATDGVPLHDRSLPQGEWFDVANHPHATFRSTAIEPRGDNRYGVVGILTIKTHAVELKPLILSLEGDTARISGSVEIDRAEVDMGMESDPNGQYVSRTIEIHVEIDVRRSGSE
ncbi:MAG: cytochrome b/b6 domain-containing protein [Porticoccaceae bacterium]